MRNEQRSSARDSSPRPAKDGNNAYATTSGPCGPPLACSTISKRSRRERIDRMELSSCIRQKALRNDRAQLVDDADAKTMTITARFDAPPARVWQVWERAAPVGA